MFKQSADTDPNNLCLSIEVVNKYVKAICERSPSNVSRILLLFRNKAKDLSLVSSLQLTVLLQSKPFNGIQDRYVSFSKLKTYISMLGMCITIAYFSFGEKGLRHPPCYLHLSEQLVWWLSSHRRTQLKVTAHFCKENIKIE